MSYKPNKNLEREVSDKFVKSLSDSAELLESRTKSNSPVDSGELKNSIEIDKSAIKQGAVYVYTNVEYAPMVEFGTSKQSANPFMRNTLFSQKGNITKKFKDII